MNTLALILPSIIIYIIETIVIGAFFVFLLLGLDRVRLRFLNYKQQKRQAAVDLAKSRLRREKRNAAYEGFFEESWVRDYDEEGREVWHHDVVLSDEAKQFYREMDRLADAQIFENTKDIT